MFTRRCMPPDSVRTASPRPVREAGPGQRFGHGLRQGGAADARQPAEDLQVGAHAELRVQRDRLRHEADAPTGGVTVRRIAGDADAAPVEGDAAGDRAQQRRLAGAVGAEQGDQLAGAQRRD